MAVLSDTAIQQLAGVAADLALIDDCLIERNSLVSGAITPATIETVKSLATPLSGQSGYVEDWQGVLPGWHVLLPLGTNPKEGDLLTIKGQKMTVQRILTPRSYAVFDEVQASGVRS